MTVLVMDSSAIVKRYVSEVGSAWVTSQVQPTAGNTVVIARLTIVEVCSALARLQRLNQLAVADGVRLRTGFLIRSDQEYLTIPLAETVIRRATDLVAKYPLRASDAIQLACALEASVGLGATLTFVCADNDLLNAAAGEKFLTENPLAHP